MTDSMGTPKLDQQRTFQWTLSLTLRTVFSWQRRPREHDGGLLYCVGYECQPCCSP